MSLTIGGITVPHAAILAPMSGVTDMPFRRAVRRAGGGLVVTEMVASAAILREVRSEMRKLRMDTCLLYTSPSPRDKRQSRMPSSA